MLVVLPIGLLLGHITNLDDHGCNRNTNDDQPQTSPEEYVIEQKPKVQVM
jgi:hypothetical protein